MCWNADISLNTFLFGCFVLVFIYLTHTYTRYKTPMFDEPLVYLFLGVLVSMQLFEFFMWRNLTHKKTNTILSKIISIFVVAQPLLLMLLIQPQMIRYGMITSYIIYTILYRIYKLNYSPFVFNTSVYNGHLKWEWMDVKGWERMNHLIYLGFYVLSLFLVDNHLLKIFGISTLLISILFYYKDGTFASMWCWIVNVFFLYVLLDILLIQPFLEYNGLC